MNKYNLSSTDRMQQEYQLWKWGEYCFMVGKGTNNKILLIEQHILDTYARKQQS
jgi:hypothetical protein